MVSRSLIAPTAGAFLASVIAIPAFAGTSVPNFLMAWDVSNDGLGQNIYNWEPKNGGHGTLSGPDHYSVPGNENSWYGWNYTGQLAHQNWLLEWNCVFYDASAFGGANTDSAFVVANIVVTNFSANTENFNLLMTEPLAREIDPALGRGSIGGTVTDLTNDEATVSAPLGTSIYQSLIDGTVEQTLMDDPFAHTVFNNGSEGVGPQDFGLPDGIAVQGANTDIGIFLNFDLTGGDAASFTAIFEVLNPAPAPAGLPLLAAFGLLAGRRRRRA
jgi:hypothetical protein